MRRRDDLPSYWAKCRRCGASYHVAEGQYCRCPEGTKDCAVWHCEESFVDLDDEREYCDIHEEEE